MHETFTFDVDHHSCRTNGIYDMGYFICGGGQNFVFSDLSPISRIQTFSDKTFGNSDYIVYSSGKSVFPFLDVFLKITLFMSSDPIGIRQFDKSSGIPDTGTSLILSRSTGIVGSAIMNYY